MHKKIYVFVVLVSCWLLALPALAQDSIPAKKVEMADRLRADGKIYVVIAVLVIILSGLILYVARLDRKIGKIEKEIS